MNALLLCRRSLPLALAALCCSCTTPEERAQAAFAELCTEVEELCLQLSGVVDAESADLAAPALEALADSLRDTLSRLDELAEDPELPQDARRRVGEQYHTPLRRAFDATMQQGERLGRRALFHSERLKRLARRELAHYSTRGVHPWPRAVLRGREYRPKPPAGAPARQK